MPHKFQIATAKNGQFVARFGYNGEIMVWSETYVSKASAQNCIKSIKKNAPSAPVVDLTKGEEGKGYRFEIAAARNGETYVRFVASNGEPMVRSETYRAKASAKHCIASIQKNAPGAAVA